MAFMDEMVNTVYFVLHSKVQISIFVSRFVPHPFFVVSDPLISDIVLWTLVHNVNHLDVSGKCLLEGCV